MSAKQKSSSMIGDTVYTFDANRRVYRHDADGRATGDPIYREHFRPWLIVGEDERSWIVTSVPASRYTDKIAKNAVLTQSDVDDACGRGTYQYRLSELLLRCRDAEKLRAIAAILDYREDAA